MSTRIARQCAQVASTCLLRLQLDAIVRLPRRIARISKLQSQRIDSRPNPNYVFEGLYSTF
jgi:hypothetical protein